MSWIKGFFMAWGMFLIIPVPFPLWDEKQRDKMLLSLPFLGLLIGSLWAALSKLLIFFNCKEILRTAFLFAFCHILSGFMHLDGYMDCCDAILSRRDLETRKKILKDSHVGSFAVIGLVIAAFIAFSSFHSIELNKAYSRLIFIPAISRSLSSCAIFLLKPMESSSYKAMERKSKVLALIEALIFIILPLAIWKKAGLFALWEALTCIICIKIGIKNLGGMSGDISGFAISLGEIAGIIGLILF